MKSYRTRRLDEIAARLGTSPALLEQYLRAHESDPAERSAPAQQRRHPSPSRQVPAR